MLNVNYALEGEYHFMTDRIKENNFYGVIHVRLPQGKKITLPTMRLIEHTQIGGGQVLSFHLLGLLHLCYPNETLRDEVG